QRADARRIAERDQLLRMSHRDMAQHHGIDQREDGRVGADAEGEREHHDRGERRIAKQYAERVAEVIHTATPPSDRPSLRAAPGPPPLPRRPRQAPKARPGTSSGRWASHRTESLPAPA